MEIIIHPEKNGYSASIPHLHIFTQADSFDELIKNIQEAIELHYEEEKEYQKKQLFNNKFYLNMSALTHAFC